MLQSMKIYGGKQLYGTIEISGAKNLALPALITTLLTEDKILLHNVPELVDISSLLELLEYLGTNISKNSGNIELKTENIKSTTAPYDFVRKMRASILVLSPLLARCKKAFVSLPGGCAIGVRGVDLHIKALQMLGANVEIEDGLIKASAPNGLTGTDITFPIITVTGTENALTAAVLAKGTTRIINAAMEPEVKAFADLLNLMGAKITGQGTSIITVEGVDSLHKAEFTIIPDRIEAGTYAIAAAVTDGELFLKNCQYDHLTSFFETLLSNNILVEKKTDGVLISRKSQKIMPIDIQTAPYPGFPTDLQAQYTVLMSICDGTASVTENIFENRFMHIPELKRMGANISLRDKTSVICGVNSLNGTQVMATDLRASVALVLAGLMANGITTVNRLYHIDRGYADIDFKLKSCGAQLERINV